MPKKSITNGVADSFFFFASRHKKNRKLQPSVFSYLCTCFAIPPQVVIPGIARFCFAILNYKKKPTIPKKKIFKKTKNKKFDPKKKKKME
jgi:hypothetical protein